MNEKCVKMCLMTFNIICLFAGVATFAGGLLLQFHTDVQNALKTMSDTISDTNIGVLSVIMLAVGGLIILVSFVGCCGVMSESKCMIGLYCIFLLLLLIGQLAIGGLGIYYGSAEVNAQLEKQFKQLINQNDQSAKDVLNSVQKFFKCCGYTGPGDYPRWQDNGHTVPATTKATTSGTPVEAGNNTAANNTTPAASTPPPTTVAPMTTPEMTTQESTTPANYTVPEPVGQNATSSTTASNTTSPYYLGGWPDSCCKMNVTNMPANKTACRDISMTKAELEPYLYENGCEEKISEFVKKYAILIGGIALGFALLEILSVIAGCMLYKSLD